MKMRIVLSVLLVTVFIATAVFGQADERYPEPQGYVSDFAGVISPSHQQQLENILREIKQKTGVELALVTMDSIPEGQDISLYAVELGHHWGVGSKDTDKGALLLLKNGEAGDRDIYLATGYGLEGDINDAKAGRILDEVTIPLIQQRGVAEAFAATAVRIAQIVDPNVELSGVPQRQGRRAQQESDGPGIIGLIFMFILILVLSRSRLGRGMLFGMLLGGLLGGHRGRWGGGGGFGGGGFGGGFGGFGGGGFGGGGAGRGGF